MCSDECSNIVFMCKMPWSSGLLSHHVIVKVYWKKYASLSEVLTKHSEKLSSLAAMLLWYSNLVSLTFFTNFSHALHFTFSLDIGERLFRKCFHLLLKRLVEYRWLFQSSTFGRIVKITTYQVPSLFWPLLIWTLLN